MFKCTGNCSLCGRCHHINADNDSNSRKTKLLYFPKDFKPNIGEAGYGIAFDVGTTTVVGTLCDLHSGEIVSSASLTNPQIVYGADVISRIAFAGEEGNLNLLQEAIIQCLNQIIKQICNEKVIDYQLITRVIVCGNTTMAHLLLGINPKNLAKAPFVPSYKGTAIRNTEELGLQISNKGIITVIPNIAGHIGSDITSGILAVRLQNTLGNSLLIDIGTNGEIVYYDGTNMYACSTAAGPAFEGAAIYQGMRACNGAIERVRFKKEDIDFSVIGDTPPIGICGSGLIDIVAELIRYGIVNRSGKMLTSEEYAMNHGNSMLCERLVEHKSGRRMIIVAREDAEDIVITQKDIREVQLAKAAIAAGIKLMMKKEGKTTDDIDRIFLAGAFGNFINKKSAVTLGLLPNISIDKIISVGNTASTGAVMALTCKEELCHIKKIPENVLHVDLSVEPEFQKEYLTAMTF